MTNFTSYSPDVANIVKAVKRHEEQTRIVHIEERHIQLVVCLLNGRYYAFSGDAIHEIVPVPAITYVPGMTACVLGVIHVRGAIESVLDMRQVLGLPTVPITPQSRIVLGEAGELQSGLLVDSVEDVLQTPESTLHKPASGVESAGAVFVTGEMQYNGHPLVLLDLYKIFEVLLAAPLSNPGA